MREFIPANAHPAANDNSLPRLPAAQRAFPRCRVASEKARRRRARRLGLRRLQGTYGQAMANADASPPPPGEPSAAPSALDVVRDPRLSIDDKRSMLMNRAYDEYLSAGDAGRGSWQRLQEIEQALQALERGAAAPASESSVAA